MNICKDCEYCDHNHSKGTQCPWAYIKDGKCSGFKAKGVKYSRAYADERDAKLYRCRKALAHIRDCCATIVSARVVATDVLEEVTDGKE